MKFINDKLHLTINEFEEITNTLKLLDSPDIETKRLARDLFNNLLPSKWEIDFGVNKRQYVMVNYIDNVWAYKNDWVIDDNK